MKRPTTGSKTVATMTYQGEDYDVIQIGCRLRIVGRRTDRSLDCRGYMDLQQIRNRYPAASVFTS